MKIQELKHPITIGPTTYTKAGVLLDAQPDPQTEPTIFIVLVAHRRESIAHIPYGEHTFWVVQGETMHFKPTPEIDQLVRDYFNELVGNS